MVQASVRNAHFNSQQEKIQRTEEKRCALIMSRSSKTELRFSKNGGSAVSCTDVIEVHRTEWFTVHLFYSSFRAPLLLLSWSSIAPPLLELRYYSFFGAPLLLYFQNSVTTPLSEHIQGYPQKMRLQRLLKL